MVITATERTQIMYLVVGMFNAAPGSDYLSHISQYVQNGESIGGSLAAGLANSSQFKALYPDYQTSTEFATTFANNLLGSTVSAAAMTEAVAAIEAKLNNGTSKADVMVDIIISLFNAGTSDAKWGNALIALTNKVDVAEWFSVEKAVSTENMSELQAILSTVTEDPATATAAKDEKNLPGVTEAFTTNLDTLVGGSGSDQFSGVIDTTGTIQVGDSLDGASSYDTLRVVAISGGLDTTINSVTNIEEVIITESSGAAKGHNLSTLSGLQKLTVNTTNGDSTIDGVATSVDFSITGQAGNIIINYSDAAETGEQTAKLLLTSAQSGNLTAAGIERVELTTAGTTTATSNLTFDAATYISITGTTNLTGTVSTAAADATLVLDGSGKIILGTLDDDIDTLTATANTGGVELTLDSEKDTQVTLGTGDDKVTTGASYDVLATDTALIAAGEGSDTLTVADSTHLSTAGHFTGFENLVLGNGVSIDLDNITGITALEITDGAGSTGATDLSAAVAGNVTVRGAAGELVLGVKGSTTLNQVDTVKITVDDDTAGITSVATITTLKMIGVEVFEVVANDDASITFSATENAGLNTVNLSGAGDIAIVTGDLATATMAIDANTATGDVTVNASAFAGTTLTITTGSGTNAITGSSNADTITGGTGNDTITGGAGADVIDLGTGTGVDTVILDGAADHVTTTDIGNTVANFGTTDVLDFTGLSSFKHGAAETTAYGTEGALGNIADLVGFQTFSSNITVADAAVGPTEAEMETYFGATEVFFVGGADDEVYVAADDGVNTYIMQVGSGGANKVFTAAEDTGVVVITLLGVTDATTLSAANLTDFT